MSEPVRKQPWMKWYPADWRADPALRVCSLAARGLWIEMLGIMHEAEPRGFLLVAGRDVTPTQLASLVGVAQRAVMVALQELEAAGVFSRDGVGAIFSRRMLRDIERAETDKANGKAGGNPNLKRVVNPPDKRDDKAQKPEARDQIKTPSSLRSDPSKPPNGSDRGGADCVEKAKREKPEDEALIQEVCQRWNLLAASTGLAQIRDIPDSRIARIRARARDLTGIYGHADALAGFDVVFAKVRGSPLLRGEKGRGWKANFDWITKTENFTKVMEDTYAPQGNGLLGRH